MKIHNGFISNSSSEAFICNTTKTLEQIKEELEQILELYNKIVCARYSFEDVFEPLSVGNEGHKVCLEGYLSYYRIKMPVIVGKVIINSAGDNTIPFALLDLIEEAYDATRVHLG